MGFRGGFTDLIVGRRSDDEAVSDTLDAETADQLLQPRRLPLEVGAGRFDPREAARLAANVLVEELEPVATAG